MNQLNNLNISDLKKIKERGSKKMKKDSSKPVNSLMIKKQESPKSLNVPIGEIEEFFSELYQS